MRRNARLALLLTLALLPLLAGVGPIAWAAPADDSDECPRGHYYTVYDEANPAEVVFTTGMVVTAGDQYQTADDRLFEVTSVNAEQFTAVAQFVENVSVPEAAAAIIANLQAGAPKASAGNVTVGVYATHSDESYVPTDGAESIRGNGGIYRVAESLTAGLKEAGAKVLYSDQRHDPHDTAAYTRSRRTAQSLLKQGPTALLDVHRDAGGGVQSYRANVEGEQVAQVRLVVGRQNPNMSSNKQFAQEIKAATDKQFPGLIKGIFFARGHYNQDLNPRNLLLEVGMEKTPRQEAQKGAGLFAKAYANYLGASTAGSQAGQARESRAGSSAAGWLIALVLVGGAVFLLISTGGWGEMSSKLRTFTTREFSNSLGFGRRRRGRKQDPDDRR